jgi:hypothetical protein
MTAQLAIDKSTYDLIKPVGGGVARVEDGRFTVQQVTSKLNTFLGEWSLDPSVGWLNFEDFKKSYDLFSIENRARRIILGTQGVKEILNLEVVVEKRVLTLSFSARTIYGEIDLDIPWQFS